MKEIVAYERLRASTLRSTWVFPLIGIVMGVGITTLFIMASDQADEQITFTSIVKAGLTPLTTVFLTMPFAQAFGHEYRDGTMRLTLSEFPARAKVFAAKLLVPALIALAGTLIVMALMALATVIYGKEFDGGASGWIVLRAIGFNVLWGTLVGCVTVITRNLAGGLVAVIVWALVVEGILGLLLDELIDDGRRWLPLTAGSQWLANGRVPDGAVFLGFTVVLLALAYTRFTKTDA
jgi:ABC-2 type transport system permease protein